MSTAVVLIGDGDPFRLGLLEDACTDAGFDVVVALDGTSVLDVVAREPPSVLLLHGSLTNIDCAEVVRVMRADAVLDGIPILVVGECTEAVDVTLAEPVRVADLQDAVAIAVERARERRRKRRESRPPTATSRDSETGAGTRAQLLITLDYELTHAHRFRRPISAFLVQARRGDLVECVRGLRGELRAIDPVFRVEPLELVTLLPDTDAAGAQVALRRVRASLPRKARIATVTVRGEDSAWTAQQLLSALRKGL